MLKSATNFAKSFRVRSHDKWKGLIRFKPAWKQIRCFSFHFGCISKRFDILINMRRHFNSGSVYMKLYHPKYNNEMKPAMSFKCTFSLNPILNESGLIHFASSRFVHMKTTCRFEISLRSKWSIWNLYRLSFNSCEKK